MSRYIAKKLDNFRDSLTGYCINIVVFLLISGIFGILCDKLALYFVRLVLNIYPDEN